MESIQDTIVLKFPPEILRKIRKLYNLEHDGAMDEAIDSLNNWIKKQHHFIKTDFPRDYLERIIITCKGSVERAKLRIEKLCTFRTIVPNFFDKLEPKKIYETISHYGYFVFYPQLLEDYHRLAMLTTIKDPDDDFRFFDFFRILFCVFEYIIPHDYCNGYVFIWDLSRINLLNFLQKLNIMELKQALTVTLEGYGVRLKGFHIISASKVVGSVVSILKKILSTKIGERIVVHKSKETLEDYISKDKLPVEYGGSEYSVKTLEDNLIACLTTSEHIDFLKKREEFRTNESLRPKELLNDDIEGISGTFKSLHFD